jgi:hypothetical protein
VTGQMVRSRSRVAGELVVTTLAGEVIRRAVTITTTQEGTSTTVTVDPGAWFPNKAVRVMGAWITGPDGELVVRIELAQYPLDLGEGDGFDLGIRGHAGRLR